VTGVQTCALPISPVPQQPFEISPRHQVIVWNERNLIGRFMVQNRIDASSKVHNSLRLLKDVTNIMEPTVDHQNRSCKSGDLAQ
jgi:hypothetical protein